MAESWGSFHDCRLTLRHRLAEPAPATIQLIVGPRQVGKTTLLLELGSEIGPASMYIACDAPEAALPGFWERSWSRAAELAASGGNAVVMLDEVQHLGDWSGRLKAEWDRIRRRRSPIHIVATGSSALRLGSGSRDTLAGRFERIVMSHWGAASLSAAFGLEPDHAAEWLVGRGSYPGAMAFRDDPARWTAYVRDAILEPAIGRDILALGVIRRPALLRQVFSACVVSPARIVSLQKLQGQLQDGGALETISHYLSLLEDAFLVAALPKHAARALRRRSAPPKLVILNNALLAVGDPAGVPDASREPQRFGAWVENACLAFAWNSGQHVAYWRDEPLEVDCVTEGDWGRLAIEVKTGSYDTRDLRGLLEFTRRFPSYRPLVVCGEGHAEPADRVGVEATTWKRFLLEGPPTRGRTADQRTSSR